MCYSARNISFFPFCLYLPCFLDQRLQEIILIRHIDKLLLDHIQGEDQQRSQKRMAYAKKDICVKLRHLRVHHIVE